MKIKILNLLLICAFFVAGVSSCQKNINISGTVQPTEEQEMILLNKYIAKNHPGLAQKSSGLYFIETKAAPAGSDSIKVGDQVSVDYSGFLIYEDPTAGIMDGYNFDSSANSTPYSFIVGSGSVIPGWDEGVRYMKNGSEAKLIIPSKLAYYNHYSYTIPAFSTLVFYMKITKKTL